MDINGFWAAVLRQDAEAIRQYFVPSAYVNWNCTNEHFTVEEFIRANCEYPGQWDGCVERVEQNGDLVITATRVFSRDGTMSHYAVSFFKWKMIELPLWTNTGENTVRRPSGG